MVLPKDQLLWKTEARISELVVTVWDMNDMCRTPVIIPVYNTQHFSLVQFACYNVTSLLYCKSKFFRLLTGLASCITCKYLQYTSHSPFLELVEKLAASPLWLHCQTFGLRRLTSFFPAPCSLAYQFFDFTRQFSCSLTASFLLKVSRKELIFASILLIGGPTEDAGSPKST